MKTIDILITGSSGFVGRALLRRLKAAGYSLVAAVRSKDAQMPVDLQTVIIDNISLTTDWSPALIDVGTVVHCAARVHVMHEKAADALTAFKEVNLHGTLNLARQAAAANVKRFVYVSSIKVNGEYTDEKPFTESDNANPQDPYGISKWQAEEGLHAIGRETGMEIVIIRPPLVYGPGVKANFFNLLNIVSKSLPLPLGSIKNSRSMIYVENLVDALIVASTHPKAAGQTYLVSDGLDVSTPRLISMIATAMKKPNRVFAFPVSLMRLAAKCIGKSHVIDRLTQSLQVDSSKIRSELGWNPPYTMEQGIQVTVDWFIHAKNSKHD